MNLRIKESLMQAGIYDGREGLYWCSKEQLEKFAELIVEDCIFAIDEQCSNSDAEGTIEAITILQKHFGVE